MLAHTVGEATYARRAICLELGLAHRSQLDHGALYLPVVACLVAAVYHRSRSVPSRGDTGQHQKTFLEASSFQEGTERE
jgi:hypothetical protein